MLEVETAAFTLIPSAEDASLFSRFMHVHSSSVSSSRWWWDTATRSQRNAPA